jgi:hypothetical protein
MSLRVAAAPAPLCLSGYRPKAAPMLLWVAAGAAPYVLHHDAGRNRRRGTMPVGYAVAATATG